MQNLKLQFKGISYCSLSYATRLATTPIDLGNEKIITYYESPLQASGLVILDNKLNFERSLTPLSKELRVLPKYTIEVFSVTLTSFSNKKLHVNVSILLPLHRKNNNGIISIYPGARYSNYAGKFGGADIATLPSWSLLEQGYALIFPEIPVDNEKQNLNFLDEIIHILQPQIDLIQKKFNFSRLALIGQSFGGYSVAGIIAKVNTFKAAIAIAGIYDLQATYGYINKHDMYFGRKWMEHGQLQFHDNPWSLSSAYANNSPFDLADKIDTPLLLIHGRKDDLCLCVEAEKLFIALDTLGKSVELVIYESEGHAPNLWANKNYKDLIKRVVEFINENLLFLERS